MSWAASPSWDRTQKTRTETAQTQPGHHPRQLQVRLGAPQGGFPKGRGMMGTAPTINSCRTTRPHKAHTARFNAAVIFMVQVQQCLHSPVWSGLKLMDTKQRCCWGSRAVFRGTKPGFAKPGVPQLTCAAFHPPEPALAHPSSLQTPPRLFPDALSSGTPQTPSAFSFHDHPSPGESLPVRKDPRSPCSAQQGR